MAKSIHLGTCAVTGKLGFDTRAKARQSRRASHFHDVSVYTCEHCNLFHVGGWHGVKDRAYHRHETDEVIMTVRDAMAALDVSADFIQMLMQTGKVRHDAGQPYQADIERISSM